MNDNSNKKGLGGWLIIIGIGVVLSPPKIGYYLVSVFLPVFTNGSWEVLTTEGSVDYNMYWAPLIIIEVVFNIIMMLWSCYLIYLFFTKHYRFPLMYILMGVVTALFIIVDAFACTLVMPNDPIFDPDTSKELFRVLFSLMIWGSYLMISERAKLTFIEKKIKIIDDHDIIDHDIIEED